MDIGQVAQIATKLQGRHLLSLLEYEPQEIRFLLQMSERLKESRAVGESWNALAGKGVALLFDKPSTRTRCAFLVACWDEGGHSENLARHELQLGKKESVEDTARVLGRMFHGIMYRGFQQEMVQKLADFAGVPVWNALTDLYHPTQALADMMTLRESFGSLKGLGLAFVGDGRNNVANSLLIASAKLGVDFRVVAPSSLSPQKELIEKLEPLAAQTGAKITITDDIAKGVRGVKAIYTDVWASMGEEELIEQRIKLLRPYRVTEEMFRKTGQDEAIFLHDLPSFHNSETEVSAKYPDICEVTNEVFEGPRSRVFDQAENRLHTIKAVMVATIGDYDPRLVLAL